MNILVTGGSGFIGSNFIRYWLSKYPEDKITNLDLLTYAGHQSSLVDLQDNPNYKFVCGDICDPGLVDQVMEGVDIVVHFAAESHVDRSILTPDIFIKTNVMGTHVLLEAARKLQIKRFHHISTDEVFGSLEVGGSQKFNSQSSYDPRSPYSASKASSDHLVRAYYHTFGLPVTITNCSNNFGPYQDPEKFIPRAITNLILGEKVKVYGKGENIRDWLYVLDHCTAIDAVIKKGTIGRTYLVGGSTEDISNLEVVKTLLEIFELGEDRIEFVADRPGHDLRYSVDWSGTAKELSWSPSGGFRDLLEQTVEWYRQNQSWWAPIKAGSEAIYTSK